MCEDGWLNLSVLPKETVHHEQQKRARESY